MKLNFTALANQFVKKKPLQTTKINNYPLNVNQSHQVTKVQQQDKKPKSRKSQLQRQDDSKLLLCSSILKNQFQLRNRNDPQQQMPEQSSINLLFMYPYQISASIDLKNIDEQIQVMKQKGVIDESGKNFIKKQIAKDLRRKSKQKQAKPHNQQNQNQHQNFLDASLVYQSKSLKTDISIIDRDYLNETHQTFKTQNLFQIDPETKSLLFKNFSKQKIPFHQNNKTDILIPKKTENSFKNQTLLSNNKQPNYMKPIHQSQKVKTKKNQPQLMSTKTLQLQHQLKQLKPKPSLELTKSSPFTLRIQSKRQNKYKQKNTNVFNELYQQAYVRDCMKSLQRKSVQKDIDERQNFNNTLRTKNLRKYRVERPFFERLQKSIQKKYYKEQLIDKYSVDEKTGQPYFQPDTTLSKHTYQKLFHRSLQKLQAQSLESLQGELKEKNKIEANNKQAIENRQQQTKTVKQISVSYKSASRTNENSLQKLSHSIGNKDIKQRSKGQNFQNINNGKSINIAEKLEQKICDRLTILFYSKKQQNQQESFSITAQALCELSERQYNILTPLFRQINQLQQTTKVSSLMFRSLLKQFLNKLNYYDKLALRENKIKKGQTQKDESLKETKNKITQQQKQIKNMKRPKNNHQPHINHLSSSMEKLNPKYDQALYYV